MDKTFSISPCTLDLYQEGSGSYLHDELVEAGGSPEEVTKTNEELEEIVSSFQCSLEDAGFEIYHSCGQIYIQKGDYTFNLTDYL